ncbi:MAG: iron ABC transporter permease [Flavobacteriales bacterium]|nr:iron ABC transporter permease [Flavobacteriales bacterium]MCB9174129.1 iron ABC transporter permease [Flavobacteriales bacterium]
MFKILSRNKLLMFSLLISSVVLFLLDLFLGSVQIPFQSIINILTNSGTEKESWQIIVLNSRLPKALAAILCGSALSVSGLQMQTLFRNPLAGPYILGISSGAGLGVAIFIMGLSVLGISVSSLHFFGSYGLIVFSFLGSLMVLLLLLASIYRIKDMMTVLILGIMLGSIITSFIAIIQYFSYDSQLKSFVMWTMGDLSSINLNQILIITPILFLGLGWSYVISKQLNLYLLGEDYAKTIGLNVRRFQLNVVIITALLTGVVTAYCGPIGFIGIIVPHLARLLGKTSNHKILIPFSILIGVNVLLFADIVSVLPNSEMVLPINAISSFIGIPIIIWIIFKNKRITNVG